ncbi:MAG: ABC transporter permease [Chloroflexi bacterium]|nr:MAG: ABC transporter permease [Phototrophicales bacterium]RMF78633.1 MAG: ABC transporter permease [Chloroflexota bacterium]
MIDDIIGTVFKASVAASTIRLATPYIFASLGETLGQRSGVLNLGVDGIMLMGAFFGYYAVLTTESLILGVLAALFIGGLMGLAMAFISVTLKAEQGISGIGVYLFGLGMSELLFQEFVGTPQSVDGFPRISIPGLSDLQFLGLGDIFFNHNLLVYVAFALVPMTAFVLNRTNFGLMIRAVGQNPEAADAMGVSVTRVRYLTVTLGGMLAGLAGASLSIALLNVFQQNLTAGQGFIAVALVYFGGWRPYGVLLGAMLFSFVNALQLQIGISAPEIPSEFAVMAPYVVTIIALMFASKRRERPDALTVPFERG